MDAELLKAIIGLCVMLSILAFALVGFIIYKILKDALYSDNDDYKKKYENLKQEIKAKQDIEKERYYKQCIYDAYNNGLQEGKKLCKKK